MSPVRDDYKSKSVEFSFVDLGQSHEFTVEDFAGTEDEPSLIIFDDLEGIINTDVRKAVQNFQSACLKTGRHHFINTINIVHDAKDGFKTKNYTLECNRTVIFPRSNQYAINDFLRHRFGFKMKQQEDVKNMSLSSRWVMISSSAPTLLLSENKCKIL